jgi:hypothetical protein
MTKKMIFVYRVGSFFFLFLMNDLSLNDMAFGLSVEMNANLSIEIHIKYAKLLILREKSNRWAYLKCVKNLRIILLKLETQ